MQLKFYITQHAEISTYETSTERTWKKTSISICNMCIYLKWKKCSSSLCEMWCWNNMNFVRNMVLEQHEFRTLLSLLQDYLQLLCIFGMNDAVVKSITIDFFNLSWKIKNTSMCISVWNTSIIPNFIVTVGNVGEGSVECKICAIPAPHFAQAWRIFLSLQINVYVAYVDWGHPFL